MPIETAKSFISKNWTLHNEAKSKCLVSDKIGAYIKLMTTIFKQINHTFSEKEYKEIRVVLAKDGIEIGNESIYLNPLTADLMTVYVYLVEFHHTVIQDGMPIESWQHLEPCFKYSTDLVTLATDSKDIYTKKRMGILGSMIETISKWGCDDKDEDSKQANIKGQEFLQDIPKRINLLPSNK